MGWRAWLVSEVEGRPLLDGVVFHRAWEPGRPLIAECLHFRGRPLCPWRRREPDHGAPGLECRCGIYAAAEAGQALRYARPGWLPEPIRRRTLHRVFGRVSLWGRIVECERGWRASHAYPERLLVPARGAASEEIADALAVYGVPVELVHVAL